MAPKLSWAAMLCISLWMVALVELGRGFWIQRLLIYAWSDCRYLRSSLVSQDGLIFSSRV